MRSLLAKRMSWPAALGLLGAVAVVALMAAFEFDQACAHMVAPVETPEPGTPRADWCAPQRLGAYWIVPLLLPPLVVAAATLVTRRTAVLVAVAVLVVAAPIVDLTIAGGLDGAYTI